MENFLKLSQEKQSVIIDAALTTFGTNGYKKASINDIALLAGISKAMVFHYFGTKKDLYLYLIQYCYDLVTNEINDNFDTGVTDFFDRIFLSSQIKLSVIKKHPATLSFLSSIYFEQDEAVRNDIKTILAKGEEIRNKVAFEGMDTSKFKDGIDPKLVMKILMWMADGFADNSNGFSNENIEQSCNEYFECMNLLKKNFYKPEHLPEAK